MADEKFSILIVEPRRDARSYYQMSLSEVETIAINNAASGLEAIDLVANNSSLEIDMVLLNTSIEDIDFCLFIHKIKKIPNMFGCSFVLISDQIQTEDLFLLEEYNIKKIFPLAVTANLVVDFARKLMNKRERKQYKDLNIKGLEMALIVDDKDEFNKIYERSEVQSFLQNEEKYYHLIGEYHLINQKHQEAYQFYKDHLNLQYKSNTPDAETMTTLNGLAKSLCYLERFEEAIQVFEQMTEKSPKNLSYKINLGNSFLCSSEWLNAIKMFDEVLEFDHNNTEALAGNAAAYQSLNNQDKANQFLAKIAGNVENHNLASFFNNQGVSFARHGNLEKAITSYKNAVYFSTKNVNKILFNLGLSLYKTGKIEESAKVFTKVYRSEGSHQFLRNKKIMLRLKPLFDIEMQEQLERDFRNTASEDLEDPVHSTT